MSFSPSNQPFKDDIELKSDLRSDTLDTRQEYDLKVSLSVKLCSFFIWTEVHMELTYIICHIFLIII